MELLDKLGEITSRVQSGTERLFLGMFGSSNERRVKQFGFIRERDGSTRVTPGSILDQINSLEPSVEKLTEEELAATASEFRERIAAGETTDDLLPETFARVREAGRRFLKMRHYDVQLVGGYFLHNGAIAEMVTGEGKTLVATLPTVLNAIAGKVHVITVNDYLALRDMEWMGPVYMGLGLTVGAIQSNMSPQERQTQYANDITYGTNNEFGFDYLRDNMKPTSELQVQGPLDFAVVDEIDNILIDEARTPLIISGPAHDDISKYPKANRIAMQLKRDVDFEVKEKEHSCHLTEEGVRHAEELAGVDSFYTAGNMEWPHLIDNSLKAHFLYKRDVNYVVENGSVVIVDEHTGRKMEGRQWSDGLHQAVESKEGVKIKEESQTLATITLQNYFKLYGKLAGMTGTAMTEANEFYQIYKLEVVAIPTNRPMARINSPDLIYRTEKEKWDAVVHEVRDVHGTGRPVLVGTTSIEQSESVSRKLEKFGIKHSILNAKFHEREAEIIAQAGRKDAVTIATNMAGRGTDIVLGGNPEHLAWEELRREYASRLDVPKSVWDEVTKRIADQEGMTEEGQVVSDLGGLHVVGTERHDSRRIDLQLRGRAGRQGDPGSSRFFLSLEDKLMRLFAGEWVKNMLGRLGMEDGEAIESRMVTRRVEAAQKKVEERHFDQRKHLLEYDEVMDGQRKTVYSYRQRILDGANCRDLIVEMLDRQLDVGVGEFMKPTYRYETICAWLGQGFGIEMEPHRLKDMTLEQMQVFLKEEAQYQSHERIEEQIEECLPQDAENERDNNWVALSRWANATFGLNTNDRELKKMGRDEVGPYLINRANESVERLDFSGVEQFLEPDYPYHTLCAWLHNQFTLPVTVEDIKSPEQNEVVAKIRDRVIELYHEKEIRFPVAVGMTNFLAADQTSGEKYDRDGLLMWANGRFSSKLQPDDLKNRQRDEIEHLLTDCSRDYFVDSEVTSQADQWLDSAFEKGDDSEDDEVLGQLTTWANSEFQSSLAPTDFQKLSHDDAREKILAAYDSRYRPELRQAERALILEVLDQAWKDHLYYMDHLRSGIGLVGYAQKDPKVEYKREGRKAFDAMWNRIDEQVTSAIFRLEKESPAFVGSLWQVTQASHAAAEDSYVPEPEPSTSEAANTPESSGEARAVDPIVNTLPKVGRNDPCPCGSGRKFKKCCGS